MGEPLVISISREFGSGGHEIAAKLAERLDLVFYDRSMLDEIAAGMNADAAELHKYDEKPTNRLLSRRVGNHTNSYVIMELYIFKTKIAMHTGKLFLALVVLHIFF